jgi:hypothetical protein
MRVFASLAFLLIFITAPAFTDEGHPTPFDDNFDAMAVVDDALAEANSDGKRVLLVLGANWCHDSRGLAHHFEDETLAAVLEAHYVLRYIDVGWRDQNHAIWNRFGVAAIYSTPTVFIIDPADETLLNHVDRNQWGTAASAKIEDVQEYFERYSVQQSAPLETVDNSLFYQSLLIEIDLFEEEEAARLAAAYLDIGRWRSMRRDDRPDDFRDRQREADGWRQALPRHISELREEARNYVIAELQARAGDNAISAATIADLDEADLDFSLEFVRHVSETW